MKNKVFILGNMVSIHCVKPSNAHIASEEVMGVYIPGTNSIYINNAQPLEVQEATLAHEILHACIELIGLCPLLDRFNLEEAVVGQLEYVFYSFLKGNTDFYNDK